MSYKHQVSGTGGWGGRRTAGEQVQAITRLQIPTLKVYPRRVQLPQGPEFGETLPRCRVNLEATVR